MDVLDDNCDVLLFGHDHDYKVWRDKNRILLIAASHKTTDIVFEKQMMISIIEINEDKHGNRDYWHRLETIDV